MAKREKEVPVTPPVEAKTEPVQPNEPAQLACGELYEMTRRVLLAGLGAAALAYDEATAFVDRLVERGELARTEARDLMKEYASARKEEVGRVSGRIRDSIAQALGALDLPRRSDLDALQKRIDALNARVEALLREKEGQGQ